MDWMMVRRLDHGGSDMHARGARGNGGRQDNRGGTKRLSSCVAFWQPDAIKTNAFGSFSLNEQVLHRLGHFTVSRNLLIITAKMCIRHVRETHKYLLLFSSRILE